MAIITLLFIVVLYFVWDYKNALWQQKEIKVSYFKQKVKPTHTTPTNTHSVE